MPGRTIAGCDRRLVVASDHSRRLFGDSPLRRISEAYRSGEKYPDGAAAGFGGARHPDDGAYQKYVLTPKGRGVFPVLVALRQWSEEFSGGPGGFPTRLVDRDKGRP